MFIFATMVCKSISCQFLNTDVVNSISRLTLRGSSRPSSFSKMSPVGLLHFSTSSPNLHRYLEALSMLRRLWSEIVLWFVFVRVLSRGTYKHFIGYCSCFGATMYGTAGSSSSHSLVCFFLEVPVRHSTLFGTTVTDSLSDLVCGVGILYSFARVVPEAEIFVVELNHWIVSFFSMTLATNIICTGKIQIFRLHRC